MAEGWVRHYAITRGMTLEVASAGTEQTQVKPEAAQVMREVGIDISSHTSKTLAGLPDPLAFDVVVTVCDGANEACPVYPAQTTRLHVSFPDPSGQGLDTWRKVRDALGRMSLKLVTGLERGELPDEAALKRQVLAAGVSSPREY